MINFRYHVVSLTAVFLALAVGMVLGTAALNGPVTEDLYNEAQSLRKSNGQLRDQIGSMEDELAGREQYIKEAAPLLLDQKLTETPILLVTSPDADPGAVKAVVQNLELADATITGTVHLTNRFLDPINREDARDLATRLLPPKVDSVPSDADGATASAALLAACLLERKPEVSGADRTSVLAGYEAAQLVDVDEKISEPAQGVIIVTDLPETDTDAVERNQAMFNVVKEFGKAGPAVLSAPGTGGDGNADAAVRSDASLRKSMSTVDNVNTSLGQLSSVLALVERIQEDEAGHYGISEAPDGRIPKPDA
ncbi:MAG: copper transporter [Micromonosporaceae bacterium]